MTSLGELQSELDDNLGLLTAYNELLELDPSDQETLSSKADCEATIADIKAQISAKHGKSQTSAPPPPPPPAPDVNSSKDDSTVNLNHSSSIAPPPPPPEQAPLVTFNTGDAIQARWSGDGKFYAATIVGKTGSSAAPVYTVKFASYGNTETKRSEHVRPLHDSKKRKADTTATDPTPPSAPVAKAAPKGPVISGAPDIDPTKVQKREPSKVSDGPTRMAPAPKKLKGNNHLNKTKASWKDFQKNGPKKGAVGGAPNINKESQFRTTEGLGGRVGFTGSGRPMQKDPVRQKWTYDKTETVEDDDDD